MVIRACPKGRALRCIPDLEKLRQKKPCFSKSGDVASIPHANPVFIISFFEYQRIYSCNYNRFEFVLICDPSDSEKAKQICV